MRKKLLSVIVPAYKQERTIKGDLANIDQTLKQGLPKDYDYEVIFLSILMKSNNLWRKD
jgi:hypothetical protein